MSEPKQKTVPMKFLEDKFIDGELTYHANRTYQIAEGSVTRWLKRGGLLAVEPNAPDEVIEAELDAGLAVTLEEEGKGTPEETQQAIEHVAEVKEDAPKGKQQSGKKQHGKKQ